MFREFLRSEYSEENMLFWLACEELKTENNPELVEEKARLIYEDYISILSPKEVGPSTATPIYTHMHPRAYSLTRTPRVTVCPLVSDVLNLLQQNVVCRCITMS